MVSVSWDLDGMDGPGNSLGETDTLEVAYGSKTGSSTYMYLDDGPNGYLIGEEGKGRWAAQSGSSLDITLSPPGIASGHTISVASVAVSVYLPTVSVSGGGTSFEDDSTPVNFTVSRDLPEGYIGTSSGDEAIPDTTAKLTTSGTASADDYTGSLPTSVTLTGTSNSQSFSITPVWDFLDEVDETLICGIAAGTGFNAGPSASHIQKNAGHVITLDSVAEITFTNHFSRIDLRGTDQHGNAFDISGYQFSVKVSVNTPLPAGSITAVNQAGNGIKKTIDLSADMNVPPGKYKLVINGPKAQGIIWQARIIDAKI